MATRVPIPTPSRVVQVVGREQHDRVFKTQDLKGLIYGYCNEPKAHYTVFSIIGAQSSGIYPYLFLDFISSRQHNNSKSLLIKFSL
jgi:hypothetical protein